MEKLKLTFVSNFLNHHQVPLCRAFLNHTDLDFHFIAAEPVPEERLSMGYEDMNHKDFLIRGYENEETAKALIDQSDVLLVGGTTKPLAEYAIHSDKIIFFYAERLYKKGTWRRFNPRAYAFVKKWFLDQKNNPKFHVLCASAFLPYDLSLWNFPLERCLKWGYFPNTGNNTFEESSNKKVRILFAGRLLSLKHPEYALIAAELIQKEHLNAEIIITGDGTEKEKLIAEAERRKLNKIVTFTGSLPYEEVYKEMKHSDIFLFPSDKQEGWGAVLNEAMQSGCACIASKEAGSSPYLIENGKNGYLMDYRNENEFIDALRSLILDEEKRTMIQKNAFYTIHELWNGETAADRLIQFVRKSSEVYYDGPLTKVEITK